MKPKAIIQPVRIEKSILLIRGEKVLIDTDLASFYGVSTKRLNEQVRRNRNRFPEDFIFQLNQEEKNEVVANCDHLNNLKYSKSLPYVFTEHGALMAASVLNTPRAVEVSVFIVRAFVKLRKVISEHKELTRKISQIERRLIEHDDQLIQIIQALKQLLNPNLPPKRYRIGFLLHALQIGPRVLRYFS
jgi:hypothetical protein